MNHSPIHIESKSKTAKPNVPFFGSAIQKKLSVGTANDTYEVEADAIADKVMRMQKPRQQNVPHTGALVQRKCAACEQEEKIQKKSLAGSITPLIQRSSKESGGESQVPNHVESQINSSRGGGNSMDYGTKNFMESRFGTDFSGVRIHTGSQAVKMSCELNAQAFTVGNDVYFNEGKYSPNSDGGKHLLAHELTHVVQQQNSTKRINRMTRAEALTYGQNLDTTYPNWLSILPNCPCRYETVENSPDWQNPDPTNLTTAWFHPGAANQRRSSRGYQSVAGSSHGQQCCYDSDNNLITEGAGAGTPDVWSAVTNLSDHQTYDVSTFNQLGWRIYTQYWRPNNGNGCNNNAGSGRRIGSGRYRIVGDFGEIDLLIISIVSRRVTEGEDVQVMATGREHSGMVGGRGHYSEIEVLPTNEAAIRLFGGSDPQFVRSYILQPIP